MALLSDIKIEEETNKTFDEITDIYYPKEACVQQYKPLIKEEVYEYWIDPFELWYYYSIGAIQRFVYNYYDDNRRYDPSTFERNMQKAVTNYSNTIRTKSIDIIRKQSKYVTEYVDKYKPTDENGLQFFIEYTWLTAGTNPCKICKQFNGKNLVNLDFSKAHWNCRCQIVEHSWYLDENNELVNENTRIL